LGSGFRLACQQTFGYLNSVPPKRKITTDNPVRDPDRTRRRILDAALHEFSIHGFAGARVDVIARRAQINKRMLYHYFGDKENLFREMLRDKLASRVKRFHTYSDELILGLPLLFEQNVQDADWVRLLGWESLQTKGGRIVHEASRRRRAQEVNVLIRRQQAQGKITAEIKPEHFQLFMAALAIFPVAFQQLTRLVTGKSATDPIFQREYAHFLETISVALRPSKSGAEVKSVP
jgi:AcrR family transcriptional regulator